jgi:ATP-dependent Clp protease ATP-binding subunit ClpA
MNIEHFTEKAREALSDADKLARQYNHSQVEVEHLLAALLAQQGGVVPQIIARVGGDLEAAKRIVKERLERRSYWRELNASIITRKWHDCAMTPLPSWRHRSVKWSRG